MKTFLIWMLVLAALVGLLWLGKKNQANPPTEKSIETKSELTTSENLYDFGNISMANGKVSTIFEITNSSNKDITLESVTTSCMCTNAYLVTGEDKKGPYGMLGHGGPVPKANKVIKAGEIQKVEVVYDPNAHGPAGVGRIDRYIYLEDSVGGTLQLEVKANVTP